MGGIIQWRKSIFFFLLSLSTLSSILILICGTSGKTLSFICPHNHPSFLHPKSTNSGLWGLQVKRKRCKRFLSLPSSQQGSLDELVQQSRSNPLLNTKWGSGQTHQYSWTETQKRGITCDLKPRSISLNLSRGGDPFVEGVLKGIIVPDNCFWSIETLPDGAQQLHLLLTKRQSPDATEWSGVIVGEQLEALSDSYGLHPTDTDRGTASGAVSTEVVRDTSEGETVPLGLRGGIGTHRQRGASEYVSKLPGAPLLKFRVEDMPKVAVWSWVLWWASLLERHTRGGVDLLDVVPAGQSVGKAHGGNGVHIVPVPTTDGVVFNFYHLSQARMNHTDATSTQTGNTQTTKKNIKSQSTHSPDSSPVHCVTLHVDAPMGGLKVGSSEISVRRGDNSTLHTPLHASEVMVSKWMMMKVEEAERDLVTLLQRDLSWLRPNSSIPIDNVLSYYQDDYFVNNKIKCGLGIGDQVDNSNALSSLTSLNLPQPSQSPENDSANTTCCAGDDKVDEDIPRDEYVSDEVHDPLSAKLDEIRGMSGYKRDPERVKMLKEIRERGFKLSDIEFEKALSSNSTEEDPGFMKGWSPQMRREYKMKSLDQLNQVLQVVMDKKPAVDFNLLNGELRERMNATKGDISHLWSQGFKRAEKVREVDGELDRAIRAVHRIRRDLCRIPRASYPTYLLGDRRDMRGDVRDATSPDSLANRHLHVRKNSVTFYPTVNRTKFATEEWERFDELPPQRQKQLRTLWAEMAYRLDQLCEEMSMSSTKTEPQVVTVILMQYTSLLISNEFPHVFNHLIKTKPPKTDKDSKILSIILNQSIRLHEELELTAQWHQKQHSHIVSLICQKAMFDFEGLTEYVDSMKTLLTREFFGYLNYAIDAERQRIGLMGLNPDVVPSEWLMVLLIIAKGTRHVFRNEINEDIQFIAHILLQPWASVRRGVLHDFIMSMAKADWKRFKAICMKISDPVQLAAYDNKGTESGGQSLINRVVTPLQRNDKLLIPMPHIGEAVRQLREDIETLLPNWLIEGLLTPFDRDVMFEMKMKRSAAWAIDDGDDPWQSIVNGTAYGAEEYERWKNRTRASDESMLSDIDEADESKSTGDEEGDVSTGMSDDQSADPFLARLNHLPGGRLFNPNIARFDSVDNTKEAVSEYMKQDKAALESETATNHTLASLLSHWDGERRDGGKGVSEVAGVDMSTLKSKPSNVIRGLFDSDGGDGNGSECRKYEIQDEAVKRQGRGGIVL
eukprot:GHVN01014550.1.p1 GENE.GHVN01014550.1~~GHVN01014550.1.p1  ORF type:complete len:1235 (+),score=275.61 GHVN01014550.1:607-4311(+)